MTDTMKVSVDMVSAILQLMIISSFFNMCGMKWEISASKERIAQGVYIAVTACASVFVREQIVATVIGISAIAAYSAVYRMKIGKRIFAVTIVSVLIILFEILCGMLLSAIYETTVEGTRGDIWVYLQAAMISKLGLLGLIKIACKVIRRRKESAAGWTIASLIVLPITTFGVVYALSATVYTEGSTVNKVIVLVSSIMLIASNVLVFYVFDYIAKQKEKESALEIGALQLQLEKEYYEELAEKQRSSNKTLHDLRNELYAIKELLKKGEGEGEREIDRICEIVDKAQSVKVTGIDAVDGLISSKKKRAESLGIEMRVTALIPELRGYNVIDLCVVTGNLLDNAIEASERVEQGKRKIEMDIRQVEGKLSITVINAVKKGEEITLETIKKEKHLHGYGLKNVEEIANRHNGVMRCGAAEGVFTVNLIMEAG